MKTRSALIKNHRGGCSAILLNGDWLLTHGTLLRRVFSDSTIRDFVKNLAPGVLRPLPRDAKFRMSREIQTIDNSVTVAAIWKCPLLAKTMKELATIWRFDDLASIFVLMKVGEKAEGSELQRILNELRTETIQVAKGTNVLIESTPFGNEHFGDSLSKGIVANIFGVERCIVMTDATAFPGSEGGPVYVLDQLDRRLCGMVIATTSWCDGERVDFTLMANLVPCLDSILKNHNSIPRYPTNQSSMTIANILNDGVAVVRCGGLWGTGILVDRKNGVFLTCSHVVRRAPEIDVTIAARGKEGTKTRLVYRTPEDAAYDVAVLRLERSEELDPTLRPLRLADRYAVRGEEVVSAGFPFFVSSSPTFSAGSVSRSVPCMIQTTCCVQSGASGGPIVSRATGEMLGMVVCNAISSDDTSVYPRLGIAIPSRILKTPLEEYLRTGDPAVLEGLTSKDPIVHNTWNFNNSFLSKL